MSAEEVQFVFGVLSETFAEDLSDLVTVSAGETVPVQVDNFLGLLNKVVFPAAAKEDLMALRHKAPSSAGIAGSESTGGSVNAASASSPTFVPHASVAAGTVGSPPSSPFVFRHATLESPAASPARVPQPPVPRPNDAPISNRTYISVLYADKDKFKKAMSDKKVPFSFDGETKAWFVVADAQMISSIETDGWIVVKNPHLAE
jgi:hypothetical protein